MQKENSLRDTKINTRIYSGSLPTWSGVVLRVDGRGGSPWHHYYRGIKIIIFT